MPTPTMFGAIGNILNTINDTVTDSAQQTLGIADPTTSGLTTAPFTPTEQTAPTATTGGTLTAAGGATAEPTASGPSAFQLAQDSIAAAAAAQQPVVSGEDPAGPAPPIGENPIIRDDRPSPILSELYQSTPDTERAEAAPAVDVTAADVQDATAATVGTPGVAAADQAAASLVTGGPAEMSAAEQLNKITSQDSPNMARARQQGIQSAARRGLGGSTIAGQASQGAMVDRALPLAQQDAATALSIAQENANRETQISSLNAQLGTDVSMFNASQLNEAERLSAQMQTAVSQGNAAAYNAAQQQFTDLQTRADLTHADQLFSASTNYALQRNEMVAQTQAQIQALNEQYLAGSQAVDLAQIQGKYNVLISQNDSAARVFDSYLSGLSAIMANEEIGPERVAQYVQTQLGNVQGALQFIQDLNDADLDEFSYNPFPGGATGPGGTTTNADTTAGGGGGGGGSALPGGQGGGEGSGAPGLDTGEGGYDGVTPGFDGLPGISNTTVAALTALSPTLGALALGYNAVVNLTNSIVNANDANNLANDISELSTMTGISVSEIEGMTAAELGNINADYQDQLAAEQSQALADELDAKMAADLAAEQAAATAAAQQAARDAAGRAAANQARVDQANADRRSAQTGGSGGGGGAAPGGGRAGSDAAASMGGPGGGGSQSTCFTAGTEVIMESGSVKAIEDVMIGDILRGQNGSNTVVAFDHPLLGDRLLHSINDSQYFVTSEHPFFTGDGWKAIDPEATARENAELAKEVSVLSVGDRIQTEGGDYVEVTRIDSNSFDPDTQLYNFKLDGDNTYYANDMLVHNKGGNGGGGGGGGGSSGGGGCFAKGTLFEMANGSFKAIDKFQIGDAVKGGDVTDVIQGKNRNDWYDYNGTKVTDDHFVKEDGVWMYVKDSKEGVLSNIQHPIFYTCITTNHELVDKNGTVFSDHNVFDYSHPAMDIEDYYCDALIEMKNGNTQLAREIMMAGTQHLADMMKGDEAA